MDFQLTKEETLSLKQDFKIFLTEFMKNDLTKLVDRNLSSLIIDFMKFASFFESKKVGNTTVTELLLSRPKYIISLLEDVLNEVGTELGVSKRLHVRFFNLPVSTLKKIRDIRSSDIGKFLTIEGIIRRASQVKVIEIRRTLQCPICGYTLTIEFGKESPRICPGCRKRIRFLVLDKEVVDIQRLIVEDSFENLEGYEQPSRIPVILKDDLTDPQIVKKFAPGTKVKIYGFVDLLPTKRRSTEYGFILEANNIEPIEQTYEEIEITKEDEEKILKLASDPNIYEKLKRSIAPALYGYDKIKEALVLQLFGGVKKIKPDGSVSRGDIHILLIGDPGVGKSAILLSFSKIAPKARYVSAKGATAVGLTASVVRDEMLGTWAVEAGVLVLANKGFAVVDEIDKMSKEDRAAMHSAMEQQIITVDKANVHATLKAETTILAAANPKYGRFDPEKPIADQIDLPPTLLNRFDLIFSIRDVPDIKKDKEIAKHILKGHKSPEEIKPEIPPDLLKKYISYARTRVKPKLTEEAKEEILNFYVNLRKKAAGTPDAPIPISPRQLEALIRLAEASAKIQLREYVTREDAQRAIDLFKYFLRTMAYDPELGQIDIDRVMTQTPKSRRDKIKIVKNIITQLAKSPDYSDGVPFSEILKEFKNYEPADKSDDEVRGELEEIIKLLSKNGEIYSPSFGKYLPTI